MYTGRQPRRRRSDLEGFLIKTREHKRARNVVRHESVATRFSKNGRNSQESQKRISEAKDILV